MPALSPVIKRSLPNPSENRRRIDGRQAEREARKAANRQQFAPGEATLLYVDEQGQAVYEMHPVSIPGYTYSF